MHLNLHTCVYIQTERERERERDRQTDKEIRKLRTLTSKPDNPKKTIIQENTLKPKAYEV